MDIKFNYDNFLIMDCEKFLSISHCFFPVSSCKNRIMLSVNAGMNTVTFHTPNPTRNLLISLSGEIMYVSALGQGVLIINSQRVAVDLLEKRSNIYSDRPRYISAGDFLTKNLALAFMPYGDLYAIDTLSFTCANLSCADLS